MDSNTHAHLRNLHSADKQARYHSFLALVAATDEPVDWAYDVWDGLLAMLSQGDNHQRAIAAQLLANLAKSDPDKRMLDSFDALLAVTRDERFVTARHALQSIWKVGMAGPEQRRLVLAGLAQRFHECAAEKNCTLIRYDILQDLRKLCDAAPDEEIRRTAAELIAIETDAKYRAKYATLWRPGRKS
jgi:hypothetical protein